MKRLDCKLRLIMIVIHSFLWVASPVYASQLKCSGASTDSTSSDSGRIISISGFDVRPYYTFSSFIDDVLSESLSMNDASYSHSALSLNLRYGYTYDRSTETGRLYPGVCQGIGAGVNIFSHPKSIGTPISLYLFQTAPILNINDHLSLDYDWNFGASMGWKPCNGTIARSNLITGSKVNAYINLGLSLRWKLHNSFSLIAGVDLTHFSNGNTSFPNPGINMLGVRLGMVRTFGEDSGGTPFRSCELFNRRNLISYDLTAYGAWRKRVYRGGEEPVLLNSHYAAAGVNLAPMLDICRFFRAGVSADFQWDESSGLKRYYISGTTPDDIHFSDPSFFRQVSVGVSARAELVMPIFSVNIGIGYNFIGPQESRASIQMANLKVYITRSLFLNIGYQLQNFQRQNNLMLGLGYTFRSNRERASSLLFMK